MATKVRFKKTRKIVVKDIERKKDNLFLSFDENGNIKLPDNFTSPLKV